MTNNAIINMRLGGLLEILDARLFVNIFVETEETGEKAQKSVKFIKVYEFLAEPYLMSKYSDYMVIGINAGVTSTNILIKEV